MCGRGELKLFRERKAQWVAVQTRHRVTLLLLVLLLLVLLLLVLLPLVLRPFRWATLVSAEP